MLSTLHEVYRHPGHLLLAVAIACGVFSFAVLLPNATLIATLLVSDGVAFSDTLGILIGLLGSISTNFTPFTATYTVLVSLLFGVNCTLLVYYLRKVRRKGISIKTASGTSAGGLFSGLLGIGCAACGTFILSSVLALIGASGLLVYLPLGGSEFGLLGVLLLAWSAWILLRGIRAPNVC